MLLCFAVVSAFAVEAESPASVIERPAETAEETDLSNEEHHLRGYRVQNYYRWGYPYYGYWPRRRWARSLDLPVDETQPIADGDQETADSHHRRYGYRYHGYYYPRRGAWWGNRYYW